MKKIITALAISLLVGGFMAQAEDPAPTPSPTVKARDAELTELVSQVYPAFVLIGGGSGVCISEDGYFVTNHHVWNQAAAPSKMVVKMAGNNRRFTADAVGADPRGDIVLGKLELKEGETVPFDKLGDSDAVEIGDLCLSIGNPFLLSDRGSEPTVTWGTVTANHRFQGGYNDCIEIDTAINPGNSGGPSFNLKGEVIGINGRNIASHNKRYNTGAGFAVPANQIKNFLGVLKAEVGGAMVVRHGLIGGLDIDMSRQDGAAVTGVEDNSDASDAGFKKGDIIIGVDGKTVYNAYRFIGITQTRPRGSSFKVTVARGEETLTLNAVNSVPTESGQFGNVPRPDDVARNTRNGLQSMFGDPFKLPPMKSTLGFKAKYNTDRKVGGYVISWVKPDGPLDEAGLQEGDILTKLNGRRIMYFADLHDVLIATPPGTEVKLTYVRNGEELETTTHTGAAK